MYSKAMALSVLGPAHGRGTACMEAQGRERDRGGGALAAVAAMQKLPADARQHLCSIHDLYIWAGQRAGPCGSRQVAIHAACCGSAEERGHRQQAVQQRMPSMHTTLGASCIAQHGRHRGGDGHMEMHAQCAQEGGDHWLKGNSGGCVAAFNLALYPRDSDVSVSTDQASVRAV